MNRTARKRGSSKYKGVHFSKRSNKWQATLKLNQKTIYLGFYNVEEDAAKAYNAGAKSIFGNFAKLNLIPEESS